MELSNNKVIDPTRICYVCGFDFDSESIENRQEWPFIFCSCCLFEYGFDDLEFDCLTIWRENWIKKGVRFGMELCPKDHLWTLGEVFKQLGNLKFVDLRNYSRGQEMNPNYTTKIDKEEIIKEWYKHRQNS